MFIRCDAMGIDRNKISVYRYVISYLKSVTHGRSIRVSIAFWGFHMVHRPMRIVMCMGLFVGTCFLGAAESHAAPAIDASIPVARDGGYDAMRSAFLAWTAGDAPRRPSVSLPSQRPVDSFRYTSAFGMRADPFHGMSAFHAGIDLAAPTGTPVHATGDAIVDRAGSASGYGNLVVLHHGAGIETRYGHLSRILVKPGDHVRKGQLIGLVGSTGRSTGSHLHYEVRVADQAIDPLPFMAPGDERLALHQAVGPSAGADTAQGGPRDTQVVSRSPAP